MIFRNNKWVPSVYPPEYYAPTPSTTVNVLQQENNELLLLEDSDFLLLE